MIEKAAQFFTELLGKPVSPRAVIVGIVIIVVSIGACIFAQAWCRSGQIDWEAVEAERKRLEEEL